MLCGLLTPTSGNGRVAGFDLRTARAEARGALGYMAQKFSLYGDLSVRQNLDFFAGVYGLDRQAQRESIERVASVFHLERYRSEEHTSELQSLMRISYAVFCLKKKKLPIKIHYCLVISYF